MSEIELTPEQIRIKALVEEVKSTEFDYTKKVEFPDPCLNFYSDGKKYPVGGRGMIGGFIGEEKSGKSFMAAALAESHLGGGTERLNFELNLDGTLIWFDTEQSAYFFDLVQRRTYDMAGIKGNVPHYKAYHLRKWVPSDRVLAMEEILYTTPNLAGVVIDGIVDMLDDYNDLKQAMNVLGILMRWSYDLNILLLGLLHVNKGDGKIRGHIGTEFKNKCDFLIKTKQPKRNQYELTNPTGRFKTFPDMAFNRDEDSGKAIYTNGKKYTPFKL